jgi:hypothetical protein
MSIQVPSNNSLALEEIYHPTLVHICSYIHYFALSLATIVTFIGSYIILTQSTHQMGQYKYIMLAQTFWFYAFDIAYVITQPTVIFPHLLVYSGGLLKSAPPEVFVISSAPCILIFGGCVQSFIFSFTYRVVQLFVGSRIEQWFNGKHLWVIYMGSYLVLMTPVFGRSLLLTTFR